VPPQLMTIRELAELLGWSEHTIYQRRYRGDSLPRSIKLGNGAVRFRHEDVETWLDAQTDDREPVA
jgi:excisionase family DNA binding protein